MSSSHGSFVWYELMTTDTAAAETFYRAVMGWDARDAGMPDVRYTVLSVGETGIGGMMALPADASAAGARPGWIGYVAVDDVDASAEQVVANGGAIHCSPRDIPGVGRFAVIADPQGAVVTLFKTAMAAPPPATPGTPGLGAWRELLTTDREAGFAFYSTLFGWTKAEAHDMGPMGLYQLFAHDGESIGGMMTKPDAVPVSFWLYYFSVAGIDAAAERVTAAGGQILMGPTEVPGNIWILQCLDPQGVIFALVGPRG